MSRLGTSGRVVIVEDEMIVARDMAATLERRGFDIAGIYTNTNDARRFVPSAEAEIAVMDIGLGGGEDDDGVTLANYLKNVCSTGIVYVTANSDQRTVERAKRTAPLGFLTKPFKGADLLGLVT